MTVSSRLGAWLIVPLLFVSIAAFASEFKPDTNRTPFADAGLSRSVVVGEVVSLDASDSTDQDGDRLKFQWVLHTPPGSGARLNDNTALRPQFTVDLLGKYTAELVVSDGKLDSVADTVTISTGNVAPVAIIDTDLTIGLGEAIVLDGNASWDFNGDPLDYHWSLIESPSGSLTALSASRSVSPTLMADTAGDYLVELSVTDGWHRSETTQVWLSTINSRPRADAGLDRNTYAGTRLRLDGGASTDADGESLTYRWSLLHAPRDSRAELHAANTATPVLGIDAPGFYLVQLIADDGVQHGDPDTMVIEASVSPLVATATGTPTPRGTQDVDGDGIPDDSDNCAEDFNPSQLDSNGDGFGNLCDADLDNDGFITNFGDLAILRGVFFTSPGSPNWNPDADFNGDNFVNFIDLNIMRAAFFGAPGPIVNRFINPAGGSWHDPANWSLGIVPNATHSARIEIGAGVAVDYSTGASEIAALRSTTEMLFTGGDLTVNGDMQVNAAVTLSGGGTLAGANILAPTTPDSIVVTAFASFTLENVTLGADITVGNGATLWVHDDLTLSGGATITLASDNNQTYLRFRGVSGASSTLGGTGEVVFGGTTTNDSSNNIEVFDSTDGLVVGPDVIIRSTTAGGNLYHRASNGPITIQGTVISDLAGRTVGLSGFPLTVTGALLQTTGGGSLSITAGAGSLIDTPISVSGGGALTISGDWSNVPGNTLSVSGGGKLSLNGTWSNAAGATISQNGGELELFGNWSNAGQITVTDGVLDIGSGTSGEWTNDGVIDVINSTVELGGSFSVTDVGTLNTSGDVLLDGRLDNTGQTLDLGTDLPGTTVLLGGGGFIVGGLIVNTSVSLPAFVSFTLENVTLGAGITVGNGATLWVHDDLTLSGGATITLASDNNQTYLRFRGVSGASSTLGGTGEVVFGGTTTNDSSNNIEVFDSTDGLVVGPDVIIRSTTAGGNLYHRASNGPITIQGTVISDLAGRTVGLSGFPLTVTGALLQTTGGGSLSITAGAGSLIDTPISVSGGGALTISGDWSNVPGNTLSVSGGGKLSLNGTWSNAAGATISQNGGELELFGNWSNAGQITVTDGVLDIGSGTSGEWTNDGVIDVINSTVELGGSFSVTDVGTLNTSGDVLLDGRLDNTGQTLDLGTDLPGTTVLLGGGGFIVGGLIVNTSVSLPAFVSFTLENVTLGAGITVGNGATLWVHDDLTLSGGATITLASDNNQTYLRFRGVSGASSTLGGTGEVVFGGTTTNDSSNNIEVFDSTDGLVVGPDVIIRSTTAGGNLYHRASNGPITIQGTVISDLAGRTVGLSGFPLTVTGALLQTTGGGSLSITAGAGSLIDTPISVSGGGALTISGDWSNVPGNTLSVSGGGKLSLNGTWSNAAGATISQNGGELELFGNWSNAGQITVTDGVLDIGSGTSGEWTNDGVIDVINSTVELGGSFSVTDVGTLNTSGDVLLDGRLDNTGQTLDLGTDLPGTTVLLGGGGFIVGGLIVNTSVSLPAFVSFTLENVTLGAGITVGNGATLWVHDDLTLSGGATITLASDNNQTYLRFRGVSGASSTLGGTGEVVFGGTTTNDSSNNIEVFDSTDGLVVGPDVIIRSTTAGGNLYHRASNGPITIQGTVISDLAGRTVSIGGGPLSIEGTVGAGAGSIINFTSDYSLTGTAAFDVDVGGTATTDFGRFTAAGRTAILDGTINITLVNAFVPSLSDTFQIMTFALRSGTFSTENGTTIGGGMFFDVNYNSTDVTLEVVN